MAWSYNIMSLSPRHILRGSREKEGKRKAPGRRKGQGINAAAIELARPDHDNNRPDRVIGSGPLAPGRERAVAKLGGSAGANHRDRWAINRSILEFIVYI